MDFPFSLLSRKLELPSVDMRRLLLSSVLYWDLNIFFAYSFPFNT